MRGSVLRNVAIAEQTTDAMKMINQMRYQNVKKAVVLGVEKVGCQQVIVTMRIRLAKKTTTMMAMNNDYDYDRCEGLNNIYLECDTDEFLQ